MASTDPDRPSSPLTYGSYLKLGTLLDCQQPATEAHDELLFVIIHQVYELWFKQILHEARRLQDCLEAGLGSSAAHTARRIATILKTIVGQLDVLETMTPRQFAAFRPELGSSSGFQSNQFREIEAVLGRRDFAADVLAHDGALAAAAARRSVFDSLLLFLSQAGYDIPAVVLARDPAQPETPDAGVQEALRQVYSGAPSGEGGLAQAVCEALVDIDEGIQEWRYRHVKMVERTIGAKVGTGGSAGAEYLRATLFRPAFPQLWEVRGVLG